MAKLRVSATLVSMNVFRDCDLQPVIVGAEWDAERDCVVLDIVGEGVPDSAYVVAELSKRPSVTVRFRECEE